MPVESMLSSRVSHLIIFIFLLVLIFPSFALALQESRIKVAGVQFELFTIPPGTFNMGSESGDGDERPVHKVSIDYSFDIGKTEVTVGQFKVFVEAAGYQSEPGKQGWIWYRSCTDHIGYSQNRPCKNPDYKQAETQPIVCISYYDAKSFCKWLSEQTGQHFRLPTEAEWEYACRAGTTGDYAGDIKQMAWFNMTSQEQTSPVAQKNPNPWGLYDMHGNVWEWCEDIYHWHYRNAPTDGSAGTKPDVPADIASRRVLRGGSWCMPIESCRTSSRYGTYRDFRDCSTGFRIVRCSKPAAAKADLNVSVVKKARKSGSPSVTHPSTLTLSVEGIEFSFVRIEPGKFIMGSEHVYVDSYNWTYELPAHEVTIDHGYYMGTTEVTLEQFDLFVEDTGYVTNAEKQGWAFSADRERGWYDEILKDWRFCGIAQTDSEPVTHICWYDAIAFCQWLGKKTSRDIRLPTEAEWEYACRAGTTGYYAGNLGEMGWCQWNSDTITRTHPVAQKKPNAWGLYDMHGNVWEWVQDMWHADCKGAPSDGSAWLDSPDKINRGVVRGGSFYNPPWLCRSYIRMRTPLITRVHFNNGFRLAMSLE